MPKIITFFEHERKTFKDLENEGLSKNEIKKLIKLNNKLKLAKDINKFPKVTRDLRLVVTKKHLIKKCLK